MRGSRNCQVRQPRRARRATGGLDARLSYVLRVGEAWVIIPPRNAKLIEARTTIRALRVQMRSIAPESTAVLEDLHAAALRWRGFPQRKP
jgi:hypothetical protein